MQKIQITKQGKAIEYLMQYQYLKINIQDKLKKAEILKNKAQSMQMNLDVRRAQASPKNKVEEFLVKATTLEKSATQDETSLEKIKSEILLKLSELKNPLEIKVLEQRYIDGLLFVLIADGLELSDEQVFKIHGNGVKHLSKLL